MNTTDKFSTERDTVVQMGKDARADLHTAVDKAADQAQPVADRLATSAHNGIDQVGDTVKAVSATLSERGKQAAVAYDRFAETGRGYVRGKPVMSLLVALAAGYGLSKLIGARKSS